MCYYQIAIIVHWPYFRMYTLPCNDPWDCTLKALKKLFIYTPLTALEVTAPQAAGREPGGDKKEKSE